MKRSLFFLLLFVSFVAVAQRPKQYIGGGPGTQVIIRGPLILSHDVVDADSIGALRRNRADTSIEIYKGPVLGWVKLGTGSTTTISEGGDIYVYSSPYADTLKQCNGDVCEVIHIFRKAQACVESEGSSIVWDDSLNFYITPWPAYCINNESYTFPGGSVTLTSDPDDPMYYAVVLDTLGAAQAIAGTPSPAPAQPYVDPSLYRLIGYIFVPEGATEPVNVTQGIIYNEGTEWTPSTSGTITANFLSTAQAVNGSNSTAVSSYNGGSIVFTNPAPVSASAYQSLSFWLRLTATLANTRNIILQFFSGTTAASNPVTATINKSTVNAWQLVGVPIGSFNFTNPNPDALRITFSGSNSAPLYIDYVQLQSSGAIMAPPPSGTTNAFTRLTSGSTTVAAVGSDGINVESSAPSLLTVGVTRDAVKGPTITLNPIRQVLTQDSVAGLKLALDSIVTYYYRNDSLFGKNRYGVESLVYAQPKIRFSGQFDVIEVADGDSIRIKSDSLGTGGGGGGTWGSITGTLSAQTDLQTALDGKVPTTRTLTINGTTYDLSANRSFTITAASPVVQTLTDGATITWDASLGTIANVTIAGNRNLSITNAVANAYYQLRVKQDATGVRTISWPAGIKWIGGVAPTLTTTANAEDIFTFWYNGTNWYGNYGYDYK